MRTKLSYQKGASAVEFALVLPLFVLLLFGIIEFSLIMYDKAMITNASREGARVGIVFRVYDKSNALVPGDIGKPIPVTDSITQNIIKSVVWGYVGQSNATSPANNLISFIVPKKSISLVITPLIIGGTNPALQLTVTYTYNFLVIPNLSKIFGAPGITPSIDLVSKSTMRIEG